MSNDESWRFRRAEELGLIDTGPVSMPSKTIARRVPEAPVPLSGLRHPTAPDQPPIDAPPPAAAPPAAPPGDAPPLAAPIVPPAQDTRPASTAAAAAEPDAPEFAASTAARALRQDRGRTTGTGSAAAPPARPTGTSQPIVPALIVILAIALAAAAAWVGTRMVARYTPLPAAAVRPARSAPGASRAPAPAQPGDAAAAVAAAVPPAAPEPPRVPDEAALPPPQPLAPPIAAAGPRADSYVERDNEEVAVERPRPAPVIVPTRRDQRAGQFGNTEPVAAPSADFSPSFDCRRATASVNQTICGDRELSALDVEMVQSYRRAVRDTDFEAQIDADQAAFLNARTRCRSEACIADIYRQRIDELDSLQPH